MSGWRVLREEVMASTPHLRLSNRRVATPTRPAGVDWFVVQRPAAAVVAPRMENGNFLLIRQERPAIARQTWEFPAGQLDGPTDGFHETALRELREEAGLECARLVGLGSFFSSVGFTDERAELFLAEGCRAAAAGALHGEHEAITSTREAGSSELASLIASGEIFDANTLCAFARMAAMGLL